MNRINVVGLGPGDKDQMPIKIEKKIKEAKVVYLRTEDHPAVTELKAEGVVFKAFDYLYEEMGKDFEKVYAAIVDELISLAEEQEILYAVPGHPMVAEKTVKDLLDKYPEVNIVGGKSFIDDLFQSVQVDPVEGFQLLDSFDLNQDTLHTGQHVIVMQVFNALMAGDVKLTLMEKYPDDHSVAVIDAAGSSQENISWMPLYEIDRFEGVYNLRSLYIPPLELDEQVTSLSTLQYYIDRVTDDEQGDVWINEQSAQSLIKYLKEETQELVEAIEKGDSENWMEELGDVLVQLLYQSSIAEKEGQFTFEDVLETVNRKIRRRHPHVFDGVEAATAEEVDALWQKIKAEEKRKNDETR
ncbi:tetrapyrrole methylase family protein / MazG family protein [Alkalibacterium subtropicum]|uniref:Tetrapyrrole methylase family protein / MazG family protein n=1 Tax=Alkalibacterium subtropicum TaxID=753702 RepID=A0A1I1FAC8_9LACT|nr:MazG nucleotide pyrophosphohydrolase domain-containing protein [Alkalibacterium subtropicum]SFB95912.1 tetrapyrrole methylase family protein / MazG family protein [Alkalibacterium subtropicum]